MAPISSPGESDDETDPKVFSKGLVGRSGKPEGRAAKVVASAISRKREKQRVKRKRQKTKRALERSIAKLTSRLSELSSCETSPEEGLPGKRFRGNTSGTTEPGKLEAGCQKSAADGAKATASVLQGGPSTSNKGRSAVPRKRPAPAVQGPPTHSKKPAAKHNVDHEDAKSLFETNYSHVYFILYDTFIQAEANLKQKVHKAHREELDGSLWLLGKVLCLLPELLARRWQCHSLSRIMAKLLHLGNSPKLRSEGVRYFLLWYKALADNAPMYVHTMYADIIPGLILPQKGIIGPDVEFSASDFLNHPNMKVDGTTTSAFNDTFSHPVQNVELIALLPPSSSEKSVPPDPRDGLDILLNSMVQATACLRWRDNRAQKDQRAFSFLLQRFKGVFLPIFCPNFDFSQTVYEPRLELPTMRVANKKEELMSSCVVVLINWISRFTHERLLSNRLYNMSIVEVDHIRLLSYQQGLIVRDVLYSSRANVNFIHEVYRQAFLLGFNTKAQIDAIRNSITVYRDWMTCSTPPPFLLEPEDGDVKFSESTCTSSGGTPRNQRLRTASYVDAISKENLVVRAGLQNILQVFVTNAANVFLVNTGSLNIYFPAKSRDYRSTPMHEQTEVCKKVLNVYRTMVMNTHMAPKTWEQLLLVLLQVTATVLHQQSNGSKHTSLGGVLGQAIFQTLIVTWIRAHTNVPVNVQLWEKFLNVLSSLTYREELIIEWDKTIQTLTRVFSRYVYALNLQDLPLDRLADSKGKRRRIGSVWQQSGIATVCNSRDKEQQRDRESTTSSRLDEQIQHGRGSEQLANNSLQQHTLTASTVRSGAPVNSLLSRSYSEGSLASTRTSRLRRKHRNSHQRSLLVQQTVAVELRLSNEILNTRRFAAQTDIRRALSLDSLVSSTMRTRQRKSAHRQQQSTRDPDDDDDECSDQFGSCSISPSVSSGGIEGGSMQDAATMQIDVLTVGTCSNCLEDSHATGSVERRSIILGGNATGWLPDSTAIMWKRMLGALGDVNLIPKPELHAQVFKHLLNMTLNLIKIKQNLGISTDNLSTPPQPTLVPPIGIVAPWCYGALELDKSFKQGKLCAVQILCTLAVYGAVSSMQQLPVFYYAMHKLLTGEDRDLIYVALKHMEGPRFLSVLLPGHTLFLLDLVHSAAILLTSLEANRVTPRAEVAALLGSLLCYPASLIPKPLLQPTPQQFELMECADLQNHILNIILRCARRDPSSKARCVALAQLGQWLLLELNQTPRNENNTMSQQVMSHSTETSVKSVTHSTEYYNPRIREVLQVLLQALQFKHRTIAIVAVDSLKLCVERGRELADMERIPHLIITAICKALEIQQVACPKETDKVVLTALMLCLGEFCMAFPSELLLMPFNEQADTLVLVVLRVLLQVAAGAPRHERVKLTADDDFDMHITSDDLQLDHKLTDANYQTSETIQACISAIRLCAKAISMNLVTHIGHFPMGIGASRLSSLVEEQDDVFSMGFSSLTQQQNILEPRHDSVEVGVSYVLSAQNMQLFMLSSGLVASFIELPALKLPGGGVTAGLVTAEKQVRVLLRDLNGKACWDASILYSEPRGNEKPSLSEEPALFALGLDKHRRVDSRGYNIGQRYFSQPMDSMISSIVNLEIISHRHTLRHRPAGELPLAKDLAPDLDQLDDLLGYIGHTSSECLPFSGAQLNTPPPSPLGSQLEAQAISIILNQRALEREHIVNFSQHVTLPLNRGSGIGMSLQHDQHATNFAEHTSVESYNATSLSSRSEAPFRYCRLLFSHLGLAGWERRSCTHLLHRTEKLLRELRNVDFQKCRETHKMAVIYVGSGQEDKNSILHNASGSNIYEMFVSALGWEIELESHNGFLGGLPRQGCGATAPYYATPFLEVIYHVATRMPSDSSEAVLLKTRHLGNDEVHIVWSEHHREYRRDILPTEFCDVLIAVYPLKNGLFRVTVNRKPEVPWFGPLPNESVVSGTCLATLIRATAINASRAKRTALPLYQQYYEERNRSLDSVSSRYKDSTTFEDFVYRIYHPNSVYAFGVLPDTGVMAPLAAALVDQHRSSVKGWVQASIDTNMKEIPLGITSYASATSTTMEHIHTSSSPRGARRIQPFKSTSKKVALNSGSTPPESPTLQLRRFK